MPIRFSRRHILWLAPLTVLTVAGAAFTLRMMEPPPENLDLSLSKATEHGLYVASLSANVSPIPVGTIQTWKVKVTTPDGKPADDVTITLDGGMPQHGHGLPTKPAVTTNLGNGEHLIEGVKFSMAGWWTLTVSIAGAEGPDSATFNLVL
jgi:hypothetical protein